MSPDAPVTKNGFTSDKSLGTASREEAALWRLSFPDKQRLTLPEGLSAVGRVLSGGGGVRVYRGAIKPGRDAPGSFAQSLVAIDLQRDAVSCEVLQDGGRTTSWSTRGTVWVVPAGVVYASEWFGTRRLLIFELPAEMEGKWGGDGDHQQKISSYHDLLSLRLGLEVVRDLASGGNNHAQYLSWLLRQTSICCEQPRSTVQEQSQLEGDDALLAVTSYIRDHVDERIAVDDLATHLGTSSRGVSAIFRIRLGTTPHKYIMDCKIEAAMEMLRDTQSSLAGVAMRLGFADQSHFSRAFQRVVGSTPSKYRSRWKAMPRNDADAHPALARESDTAVAN